MKIGFAVVLLAVFMITGCQQKHRVFKVRAGNGIERIAERGIVGGRSEKEKSNCYLQTVGYNKNYRLMIEIENVSENKITVDPADFSFYYVKEGKWEQGKVYSSAEWRRKLARQENWARLSALSAAEKLTRDAGKKEVVYEGGIDHSSKEKNGFEYGGSSVEYDEERASGVKYSGTKTTVDYTAAINAKLKAHKQAQEEADAIVAYNDEIREDLLEIHTLLPGQTFEGSVYVEGHDASLLTLNKGGANIFMARIVVGGETHEFIIDKTME